MLSSYEYSYSRLFDVQKLFSTFELSGGFRDMSILWSHVLIHLFQPFVTPMDRDEAVWLPSRLSPLSRRCFQSVSSRGALLLSFVAFVLCGKWLSHWAYFVLPEGVLQRADFVLFYVDFVLLVFRTVSELDTWSSYFGNVLRCSWILSVPLNHEHWDCCIDRTCNRVYQPVSHYWLSRFMDSNRCGSASHTCVSMAR